MGVPAFFKWIANEYPGCVKSLKPYRKDGTHPQFDAEGIDNLYLDMNAIIHPCCHPEFGVKPENESDMFNTMFTFLSWIIDHIRPKQILYLAVDGVAPRAKMNQQRARRFMSAR